MELRSAQEMELGRTKLVVTSQCESGLLTTELVRDRCSSLGSRGCVFTLLCLHVPQICNEVGLSEEQLCAWLSSECAACPTSHLRETTCSDVPLHLDHSSPTQWDAALVAWFQGDASK